MSVRHERCKIFILLSRMVFRKVLERLKSYFRIYLEPLLLCCLSRSSSELSEPTLHVVDHPAHRCPVRSSRGHLPLPVDPAVSNHQR